jgi:cytochrome P450
MAQRKVTTMLKQSVMISKQAEEAYEKATESKVKAFDNLLAITSIPLEINNGDDFMSSSQEHNITEPAFLSEGFFNSPYQFYSYLRNNEPLYWSDEVNAWLVSRHRDVSSGLRDNRFSVAEERKYLFTSLSDNERKELALLERFYSLWLLYLDPPTHTRIRKAGNKCLTHHAIKQQEERIVTIVDNYLNTLEKRDNIDILREFAEPLAISIITDTVGILPEAYPEVKRWTDALVSFFVGRTDDIEAGMAAQEALYSLSAYLDQIFAKTTFPQNESNLLSHLVSAEKQGIITREESIALYANMLLDGHEPIANTFVNGFLALLQNREQLILLQNNPQLLDTGVEELIRFDPPFQNTTRTTSETIQLYNKIIAKGDRVIFLLGSANRDNEYFDKPDELDITRNASLHRTFGLATHFCMGATLARPTLKIAYKRFIEHFPNVVLQQKSLDWLHVFGLRALQSLSVSL